MFSDVFRRAGRLLPWCVWLDLRTAEPLVYRVVAAECAGVLGVLGIPVTANLTSGERSAR